MPRINIVGVSSKSRGQGCLNMTIGFLLTFCAFGCDKEETDPPKLYSRNLTLERVENADLEIILNEIETTTKTSIKDIRKDMDGHDMFLYSSGDVVVFVRRKFDKSCDERGCPWEVNISPTNLTMPQAFQKKAVDSAFTSMVGADEIQSHLGLR